LSDTAISPKAASSLANFDFEQINILSSNQGSPLPIQTKLTIGEPGDKYEQEADNVARAVVQQINSPQTAQREEEIRRAPHTLMRVPLQRQGSIPVGPASNDFEQSLNQARSGGSSMEPKLQAKMESAMGADFSGVKIHTDTQADWLSRSIQAKAFTTGSDVFFKQGAYDPNSRSGQKLLAHELTHVVQQTSAPEQISREIDEDTVQSLAELLNLGIEHVKLVEVPTSDSVVAKTAFKDYPSTYGLSSSEKDLTILHATLGVGTANSLIANSDPMTVECSAKMILDVYGGGGGYVHTLNMGFVKAGDSNINRTILHEMGHSEQNLGGANKDTTNQMILEYHNVLKNENKFVGTEEGKDQELRTSYAEQVTQTSKSKNKTWDDFIAHATDSQNPQKDQNQRLINEILDIISRKEYESYKATIKQNLVLEYFNRLP
jgi:hypothetical protein